jgi:hypothetical protein
MREKGHPGKHNTVNEEPKPAPKQEKEPAPGQ